MTQPSISLSGIKPTGTPHLGNILGMVFPALKLQDTHECFYFIANLHALTTNPKAEELKKATLEVAATWLALGLDPSRATLFVQSDIPEVTELMWILSCCVSLGDLFRAHAFKAARDQGKEGQLNHGTFSYPVLMAADILLYSAHIVPVGKDQVQHLEMARAIAARFNHYYGEVLKEPLELVQNHVAVVPGTDGRKMSKSYQNGIEPLAPKNVLKKQVMSIVTDSKGLEDPKDPTTCHIVALYRLLASAEEVVEMEKKYRAGNYGYGHAKIALLEKIEEKMGPARERYQHLLMHPQEIETVLQQGAQKARERAQATLTRVKAACGIR